MEFCPKCQNMLDISRTAPKVQTLIDSETPTSVSETTVSSVEENKDLNKLIKKFEAKKTIEHEDVKTVSIELLSKHQKFLDMKPQDKEKLLKIITVLTTDTDDAISAYKLCKNCLYSEHLTERTLVISRMNASGVSGYNDSNRYGFMKYDKSLPHTRNYVCKNKSCPSHTDHTLRNAVWYRPMTDSYMTYMTCCECSAFWLLSSA